MPTITQGSTVVAAMNVFDGKVGDQQRLVDIIVQDIVPSLVRQHGFVSTALHRSTDGTRIVQYTQWESLQDHYACLNSAEMAAAGARLLQLLRSGHAQMSLHTYEVPFVMEARREEGQGVS